MSDPSLADPMVLGTTVTRSGRFSYKVLALIPVALLGCGLLVIGMGDQKPAAVESAVTMGAVMQAKASVRSPAFRFPSAPWMAASSALRTGVRARSQVSGNAVKEAQLKKMGEDTGFISALDESGGSSPKTLAKFGITEYLDGTNTNKEEMFNRVHDLRAKIMTNPTYKEGKIIGSILFEDTINRDVDGMPTCQYLWDKKKVVPFLKTDVGLDPEAEGVQMMKANPGLEDMLDRGLAKGCWGTKQRSLIKSANPEGIKKIVEQQFELGKRTVAKGMIPILEPEVDITASDKAEIEEILFKELKAAIEKLPADDKIMLKLSLPEKANIYKPLMEYPQVVRIVALSGGYGLEECTKRLAANNGMIASFSRTLREDLNVGQSDEEFTKQLGENLDKITAASST